MRDPTIIPTITGHLFRVSRRILRGKIPRTCSMSLPYSYPMTIAYCAHRPAGSGAQVEMPYLQGVVCDHNEAALRYVAGNVATSLRWPMFTRLSPTGGVSCFKIAQREVR